MNTKTARELLKEAPRSLEKSAVNPNFTQNQVIDLIINSIIDNPEEKELDSLMTKRVYQVVRNQRRPRY